MLAPASWGWLFALLHLTDALNITAPDVIEAGENVTLTVGFDFWKQPYEYMEDGSPFSDPRAVCVNPPSSGCSYDSLWQHYRLYLFTPEFMFTCASYAS